MFGYGDRKKKTYRGSKIFDIGVECRPPKYRSSGEVAEWLNAAVSKTVLGSHLTRVRIPLSPLK